MENEILEVITESLINKDSLNNSMYCLKLTSNRDEHLLFTLLNLLQDCDEFIFSVAFVSESATKALITTLNEIENKGVNGRIIIGNKQDFSDPNAIVFFDNYKNIDVRFNTNDKLHTKGYFFRKGSMWTIIVGSSNLTMSALKTNEEWNIIVNSLENGKMVEDALKSFEVLWNESQLVENSLEDYRKIYQERKVIINSYREQLITLEKIVPNEMQRKALECIEDSRKHYDKALVISATGTGKTFLAAFDVMNVKAKRVLFIVHRANIAKKAMQSFKKIMPKISMSEYNGNVKNKNDYIFSTIQTLSLDTHLNSFLEDEFDYIIIDEVHRSGAPSYQKVLNYFKPKFLLGLTATPERSDEFNIYELFDYNVPYEIRLNEAIENNMVVPFHYFGVTEVIVDGEIITKKSKVSMKEKAKNIKEKSNMYGYCGDKVRGLIFVDNRNNAKALETELNTIGYKTKALTGDSSDKVREDAIERLGQNYNSEDYLDFIITVDIFNEGIDIPCVNQVLLLRATESVIIYIQQLGRGLRKATGKEYLVILDFIGNYNNNFLIPVALSGDSSFDVDKMKQFVSAGSTNVAGNCTVNFEAIASEEIINKIKSSKFSNKTMIKNDYNLLKQRLNRIPMLFDFFSNSMLSPEHILKYRKSYYSILKEIDVDYEVNLNNAEITLLEYLSCEFALSKRIHEILVIKLLLENNYTLKELNQFIEVYLKIPNQYVNTENAVKHLSGEIFLSDINRAKYSPILFSQKLDKTFYNSYFNNMDFKLLVDDIINLNLCYVQKYYPQTTASTILLHKEYKKKEAFHMLNLDFGAGFRTMNGYIADNNKVIIFMKTDKSSYNNLIVNPKEVIWFSTNKKEIFSNGEKNKLEFDIANNNVELEIFIRKSSGEKYYYCGKAKSDSYKPRKNEKNEPIIEYLLILDIPLNSILFKYLADE